MVRKKFMLVAGEPSGDLLGAELVGVIRQLVNEVEATPAQDYQPLTASLDPEFFGVGGPGMAAAGVKLALDMTQHSVVGIWEVLRAYGRFRRIFRRVLDLAIQREPDAIIFIDFSGFNLRLGRRIRRHVNSLRGTFGNWRPRLIQYVSPQVWASRPARAQVLAHDFDLLLSIIPFEKEWYAKRAPGLRVEFVGNPIVERYAGRHSLGRSASQGDRLNSHAAGTGTNLLLLPGSRVGELRRHLPVMLEALKRIQSAEPAVCVRMVLPNEGLAQIARQMGAPSQIDLQISTVGEALAWSDVAIASTGTVTLECAYFGVPTVALYRTSPVTFAICKRFVQVPWLAMPNLLAKEEVFPEFIQDRATGENIARAALELLSNPARALAIRSKLESVVASLGPPGAIGRAAKAIVDLVESRPRSYKAVLG